MVSQKPTEVVMHSDCNSDVSVPPLKIFFLSVDPKHDYYLQIWKNNTATRKTLQCPELIVLNMVMLEYSLVL